MKNDARFKFPNTTEFIGKRYGKLLVVSFVQKPKTETLARVRCDCGNEKLTKFAEVKIGKVVSCGCHGRNVRRTHGYAPRRGKLSSVYCIWRSMRRRCNNPSDRSYHSYGGRGIAVCERWRKFENFLADMGEPSPGMSIDRINNDGNYEPGNCRWATASEQTNNMRSNVRIVFDGRSQTLSQWSRETGVNYGTLRRRVKAGWPNELLFIKASYKNRNKAEIEKILGEG